MRPTKTIMVSGLGKTPARSSHKTGVIYLNYETWHRIPKYEKKFILLHEEGHLVLNTPNEFEADLYAFNQYVKKGYPLKHMITALTRVLDENNPVHFERAKRILELTENQHKMQKVRLSDHFLEIDGAEYESDFFGKKARERRQGRKADRRSRRTERREDRQSHKLDRISARADGRSKVAQSGGGWGQISTWAGNLFQEKFGGGSSIPMGDPGDPGDDPPKQNNTGMIIGIVVVVVVVVVAVVVFRRKKGK